MESTRGIEAAPPLNEGRYQLREVLGSGGMATVYAGFDARLRVPRAIKILAPSFWGRKKVRARFYAEARTMAQLDHRNIVHVYDYGVDGERAYIIMELVDGGALTDWIEKHGPMPPRLAMDVMISVLDALEVAHRAGFVHRDIKPHNVLITSSGEVRVTDFGIARLMETEDDHLTKTGAVMGTWAFMAPEQRTDAKHVDVTADLYSVGATLHALLTGQTPKDLFVADMDASVLDGIPEPIAPFVRQATRYKREERYQTATEMREAAWQLREQLPPPPQGTPTLAIEPGRPSGTPKHKLPSFGTMVPSVEEEDDGDKPTGDEPTERESGATAYDSLMDDESEADAAALPEEPQVSSATAAPLEESAQSKGDDTNLGLDQLATHASFHDDGRPGLPWGTIALSVLALGVLGSALAAVIIPGLGSSSKGVSSEEPAAAEVAQVDAPATVEVEPVEAPADAALADEETADEVAEPAAMNPPATEAAPAPAVKEPAPQPVDEAAPKPITKTTASPTPKPDPKPAEPEQAEPAGPSISHARITSAKLGDKLRITARVSGTTDHDRVTFRYRPKGSVQWRELPMFQTGASWSTSLEVSAALGDGFQYFISADSSRPEVQPLRVGSPFSPISVSVAQ